MLHFLYSHLEKILDFLAGLEVVQPPPPPLFLLLLGLLAAAVALSLVLSGVGRGCAPGPGERDRRLGHAGHGVEHL